MSEEILKIANSPILWVICGITVAIAVIQALLYMRLARKVSKDIGISQERCKQAVKTGMIASIGPSVSVFVVMVGLMSVIGGPMSWLRLSIIGSAATELTAAKLGAEAMGIEFGGAGYTEIALLVSWFTMTLNGCGWLLFVGFFGDKMDLIRKKISGTNPAFLAVFMSAAMVGLYGNLTVGQITIGKSEAVSTLVAGFTMYGLILLAKKIPFIREYNLGIAMLVGMIAAMVSDVIIK